jgi:hypothetical protein
MYDIEDGIINGPQKVVIYGPEGIGKSSFAAMFPNPLFADVEGSTKKLNVKRFNKGNPPSSWTILLAWIDYIKKNPELCNTFIVDTADWAETLCINNILSSNQKTSLSGFAHGQGYVILEEEFGRFLNALSDLICIGINVVITAHALPRKFELPDEMGAFDRWEMKLEKKVAPLLKEWADMVLFVNYKTYVVTSENDKRSKKAQGGQRVIYTTHHPCWDAKNRHGLPEELTFNSPEDGWKQIAHCIPERIKPQQQQKTTEPEARDLNDEPDVKPSTNQMAEEILNSIQKPDKEPAKPEPPKNSLSGVPKALADLMTTNNVTVSEIQQIVGKKGYFPADTPIANYPHEFIEGCLVGAWPQVFQAIKNSR